MRALALACALIAAGCVSSTRDSAVEEQREIESVEIAGAPPGIDTSALTKALANHSPLGLIFLDRARLEPLALEADRRRVEVFFREQGYFAAEVGDAELSDAPESRVALVYRVQPGPPSIVKTLAIHGAPDAPDEPELAREALLALAAISAGSPFRYVDYEAAKDRLHDRLFAAGYAHAKIGGRVEVARATSEVAIDIQIEPGPLVIFGPPVLTGSTALPQSSLAARIAWTEGERFDPQRLATTRRRIEELSLTGAVGFELAGVEQDARSPVRVNVEDSLPNELRLGGGFGFSALSYDIRGRATYTRKNFFDPLYTLRTDVRPGFGYVGEAGKLAPKIEASAEIIRDDFLLPRLSATLGAAFSAIQYELYRTLGPSAYVTFGHPLLEDRMFIGLRVELDNVALSNVLTDADRTKFGAYDPQRFAMIAPSISYDSRDDLLSPRKGYLLRFELEAGRAFGDSSASWLKIGPEARAYTSLFTEHLIAAGKIRFGSTIAQDGRVPLLRRYFAGGAESQRGFSRRLLSPSAIDVEGARGPLGGETLLESSAELRLDLFQLFGSWLGIVGFVDAGDVTLSLKELDLLHLHVAAGPGLRYHTPIGPIRLDFGIRLNRRAGAEPQPDSNWAFHFSLGEAF